MISLIGMGSGCPESLTAQGLGCTARRRAYPWGKAPVGAFTGGVHLTTAKPCISRRKSLPVLPHSRIRTPLFCTAATPDFTPVRQSCCPCCGPWDTLVRVLPGLSSVQLLAAAVGRPWQDWKLVSAHGRVCDPVAEVLSHPQVFFLTGGGDTPATLCAKLTAAGLGAAHALVGENLGTPAEAIRFGLARELAEQTFAPLSVLLIEREALPSRRTPGLPDDAFIRGAVPMTKAGGARRRAGKAGSYPHGHPMGRGRGHRQRERGIGACRPCRAGICRRV